MFATPAFAQTTAGAAPGIAGLPEPFGSLLFFVPLFVLFYFLMIRPQQQRMKAHQAMVSGVKRNDTVVLNSGVIGKVVRVEDKEIGLEIAQGVSVKVVKAMIAEVRTRGEPAAAANDAKV
ncbi:MAG: preprotein translocase subunit YajC [Alphaproteobacteria bacterium PA2]|jgi:preprotein translocase subunit YajC|nr:MAG: preprotein translocase subunit YajC [Alphaproteobacteria bacterium PA2]